MKMRYNFLANFFALVTFIDQYTNGQKNGDRLSLIKSNIKSKNLSWEPTNNPIFENKTDEEMKQFLGIDIARLQTTVAREKYLKPTNDKHRGRGDFSDKSWQNVEKYRRNYWNEGSNSRGHWNGGSGGGRREGGNWDQPNNDSGNLRRWGNQSPADQGQRRDPDNGKPNSQGKGPTPESFDWRDHTDCQSVHDIRYQQCGDCWAVASAAVMSDRYCLWTHQNRFFSARQIVSCRYQGSGGGCNGGWPKDAMEYYKENGVPTGGDPTVRSEPQGCVPYLDDMNNRLRCPRSCDSRQPLDNTKAGDYYEITTKNERQIMQEIFTYGPVVSIFEVFQDFGFMGRGVYQHAYGRSLGWHAVRLIGYGTQNGVPYWLAANSWGNQWGDNGYFKILRGQNHCGIESWVTVVYPAESYNK